MSIVRLSLIVPAYRAHAFIEQALQSAAEQLGPEDEVIVVSDGCPVGDYESICSRFDQRIRLLNLKTNRGVSGARNAGIAEASGTHLVFLDADDLLGPGQLDAIRDRLNRPDPPDLIAIAAHEIDEQGQTTGLTRRPNFWADRLEGLLQGSNLSTSQVTVRKATAVDAGLFDPFIRYCEDWDLWLRIACRGASFEELENTYVQYRRHDDQASAHLAKIAHGWEQVLAHARAYVPNQPTYQKLIREMRWNTRVFRRKHGVLPIDAVYPRRERWLDRLAIPRLKLRTALQRIAHLIRAKPTRSDPQIQTPSRNTPPTETSP